MTHITIIVGVVYHSQSWLVYGIVWPYCSYLQQFTYVFFAENHETSHGMLVNHLNIITIQYIGIRENLNWKP